MAGPARRGRRAGRRTNLGLLLLLLGALTSGVLLFAAGTPAPATAARVAHGVTGLGLLVLTPWKAVVVRHARRRYALSWGLVGLLAVCVGSGLVQVWGGYGLRLGISPVQVHVGSAVGVLLLGLLHVLRHRPVRVLRSDLGRRRLLATGVFTAGAGAVWGTGEGLARLLGPRARSRVATGSHRVAVGAVPATIWLFDRVPVLDASTHRVALPGRSGIAVADLDRRARDVSARLDCTSGWFADGTWSGVALSDLLDPAALASARSVVVTSTTGYRRRFPPADAPHLWLATRLEGRPLLVGCGAPVRLVAPGHRGFWWVKWVASVELSDRPAAAQPPFPLQ